MAHTLRVIAPQPGIQRDRTQFSSPNCIDGQWVRFYEGGDPTKIGGYKQIGKGTPDIIRGMYPVPRQGSVDFYLGRSASLSVFNVTTSDQVQPEVDRTPVGFDQNLAMVTLQNDPIQTTNLSNVVVVTVPTTTGLTNGEILTFFIPNSAGGITSGELSIAAPITILSQTTLSYVANGTGNGGSGGGAGGYYTYQLDTNLWTFDLYTLNNSMYTSPDLPADPLTSTTGSGVVIVTTPAPTGLTDGEIVTIAGATGFNSLTAPELNISANITVLSPTTFSYVTTGTATPGPAGGGATVTLTYGQIGSYIIAHAAPNADDINNNVETVIWAGDITQQTPLVSITSLGSVVTPEQVCSGGIVCAYPYFFKYGNDGVVVFTINPFNWTSPVVNAIAGTKIIKGLRTRGGSNSPAVLFWSMNSLVRASFVGSPLFFAFDTIQDDISVMGQNSILTYNNIYFWIGVDQFYIYNGVVTRLENDMSSSYVFDNINMQYRNKVWGFVLPRFHEVWWFWPFGNATECTNVIIYNYQLNTWYDSVLGRTAGVGPNFYAFPLMADSNLLPDLLDSNILKYGIWQHEFGTDMILNQINNAIDSYYTTNITTFFDDDPRNDRECRIRRIEPDFTQTGQMTVTVLSRDFANGPVTESNPYPFNPNPLLASEAKIDLVNMGRLNSFKFRSNVAGGSYQAGKILLDYDIGDRYP